MRGSSWDTVTWVSDGARYVGGSGHAHDLTEKLSDELWWDGDPKRTPAHKFLKKWQGKKLHMRHWAAGRYAIPQKPHMSDPHMVLFDEINENEGAMPLLSNVSYDTGGIWEEYIEPEPTYRPFTGEELGRFIPVGSALRNKQNPHIQRLVLETCTRPEGPYVAVRHATPAPDMLLALWERLDPETGEWLPCGVLEHPEP